jgi:SH3-like domain-containing protein
MVPAGSFVSAEPDQGEMRSFVRGALIAAALAQIGFTFAAAEEARPMPYFVSLGSGEVNLRTGPGVRYPIEWVYRRSALPVEVIGRFDHWRQIRDWQGTEGWVHQNMLSGRRTLIVTGERRALRREPRDDARAIAEIEPGVIGEIRTCATAWCEVRIAGRIGWLQREAFWGSYPSEQIE